MLLLQVSYRIVSNILLLNYYAHISHACLVDTSISNYHFYIITLHVTHAYVSSDTTILKLTQLQKVKLWIKVDAIVCHIG